MYLKTQEVRDKFIEFFTKNKHTFVPSSSLVPYHDPSLMFVNAGMVQFKNIFSGLQKPSFTKAVSSQRCIRAGGKHNDLDNVGYTTRHHTFFEMLGNFSFGDYFKEEAIFYAWELLTKDFLLPASKLYITVYDQDFESMNIWKKLTGFGDDKIIKIKDNFWSMGDTGPCGPCSEIFFDHGEKISGGLPGSSQEDGDRYVEIWNIVFMEFEQLRDKRIPLPIKSIDTGMGLERIAAVLQGQYDNYDIDIFQEIIASIEKLTNTPSLGKQKFSHRIVADHLRSTAFLIADGIIPSNEERGYVLRRIMRRAMRHLQQLGTKEPSMHILLDDLIKITHDQQLINAKDVIAKVIFDEEKKFLETVSHSLKILQDEIKYLKPGSMLSGEAAFKLYDTYGMPLDLTQDVLREKGLKVDGKGFAAKMEEQRQQGKKSWHGSGEERQEVVWFHLQHLPKTDFVGYDILSSKGKIIGIVQDNKIVDSITKIVDPIWIITDKTPFYAESGGQVGDVGQIITEDCVLEVVDTKKFLHFHAHLCKATIVSGEIKNGIDISLEVDNQHRTKVKKNHTATHLLHSALKRVLGSHVMQKGSLVAADRLRFDFNYDRALSLEHIEQIENLVNEVITQNHEVKINIMSKEEAEKIGAMMLFGEKYDEMVRVISVGQNESTELCGGTHVSRSGDIGLFKITSQSSVASGIRRIEAVTGLNALSYIQKQVREIIKEKEMFEIAKKDANKCIANLENKLLQQSFIFEHKLIEQGNFKLRYLICQTKASKDIINACVQKFPDSIVAIISVGQDKSLIIAATKSKLNVVSFVKELASQFDGSAGGSNTFAQGGFKMAQVKEIDKAIKDIKI